MFIRTTVTRSRVAQLALLSLCAGACSSDSMKTNANNPAGASGAAAGTPVTAGATSAQAGAGAPATGTGAAGVAGAATSGSAGASRPAAVSGGAGAPAAGSSAAGAGAAGSVAAAGGNTAGASGSAGGAAGPAGAAGGAASGPTTGSLPAVTDLALPGPFPIKETDNTGPGRSYTTIEPMELGKDGVKHPILSWGPGAGSTPAIYQTLLNHIASHGFVVVSYNSTPQGPELSEGIDWIIMESTREGSAYAGKLDTSKIAMGGQSAGSLATFVAAGDKRLTTTLHINGGTFEPHTDVKNLAKPALFICGDDPSVSGGDGTWQSDLARPNCDVDFKNAMVPVWYGVVIGASHTTVIDNPLQERSDKDQMLIKQFMAATVGWLRWQLAGDEQSKALFVGPSCGYCTDTKAWLVQQKDLQ